MLESEQVTASTRVPEKEDLGMSIDDAAIALEWIEEAVEAFHTALDAHTDTSPDTEILHNRADHWINDNVYAIVSALLAAGWTPPPDRGIEGWTTLIPAFSTLRSTAAIRCTSSTSSTGPGSIARRSRS
jgi:hypothetical protein